MIGFFRVVFLVLLLLALDTPLDQKQWGDIEGAANTQRKKIFELD